MTKLARNVSVLAAGVALMYGSATSVFAADASTINVRATGQIVLIVPCGDTNICQTSNVTGIATRLGAFTGELHENVNLVTGAYTGEATFNFAGGGTLSTRSVGQVLSEVNGLVAFHEDHEVVSATGRLSGTVGTIEILGTSEATGALVVSGSGQISR